MKTRTSASSTTNTTKCILIVVISLVLILPTIVTCFNFENRLPILKQGQSGSYFGYSIAEHVELVTDRNGRITDERKW